MSLDDDTIWSDYIVLSFTALIKLVKVQTILII